MWYIITSLACALVAGVIARSLVSGPSPRGCINTIALGIGGSFLGGLLGYLLFHKDVSEGPFQPAGLLGSIVGAVLVLLVYRRQVTR